MRDILAADTIKNFMKPLIEKGFFFDYFYEKENGENVYICRFKKGKDYLDWRETENGKEIELCIYLNNTNEKTAIDIKELTKQYPKQRWMFFWKHVFKKPTADEYRAWIAECLVLELESEKPDFFGIKL